MYDQFQQLYEGEGFTDASLGGEGLSGATAESLRRLTKTLTAGSGTGYDASGFRGLIFEDLENTLHIITFGERQFARSLFRKIKGRSKPATSVLHEYSTMYGYGETGATSSEVSTTLNPIDAQLQRAYANISYFRTKRAYSKVSVFTRSMESSRAVQITAGTLFLTSMIERLLYVGDPAMVPTEPVGLLPTAIANGTTINMAGQQFSKPSLIAGAMNIANASGFASDMYMPLEVQQNLDQTLIGDQDRIVFPYGASPNMQIPIGADANGIGGPDIGIMAGSTVAGFRTSFAPVIFNPHIFCGMRRYSYKQIVSGSPTELATSPNAPNTPTTLAATASGTGGGFTSSGTGGALNSSSQFNGVYAGTYYWRVSAENANGESIPAAAVSATVASGGKVTITWDSMASSGATCYRIYRSQNGDTAANCVYITRQADNGLGGTQTYVDTNQWIAGCFNTYMMDLDEKAALESYGWAQLAPMSLDNLPDADTTKQFIQFIFGTPVYYAPQKMQAFTNVGIY